MSAPTYNGFATLREAIDAHARHIETAGANGKLLVLTGADLRGADLRCYDLSGANLDGANLRSADLRLADLVGADLGGADLGGAELRSADLCNAYMRGVNLRGADLRSANLSGAQLGDAHLPSRVVVPDLDAAILCAIETPGNALNMEGWHTCATTHCRAGWAITLAAEAGRDLERAHGLSAAGALIYAASDPERPVPDFYVTNDEALADMRERAGTAKAADKEQS